MLTTAFVIVKDLQYKLQITKCFKKQSQFQLEFPRSVREVFRLEQECRPALIIVFLPNAKDSAMRICRYLKHDERTKEIPLLLIYKALLPDEPQVADACLGLDFGERELEQTMRQLTMGY